VHAEWDPADPDVPELRRLLNEWDPIGVYDPIDDFPADEYDCLYTPLLTHLRRGDGEAKITEYLRSRLASHFGLHAGPSTEQFAVRLCTWWDATHGMR
jgi:hypothetical protein